VQKKRRETKTNIFQEASEYDSAVQWGTISLVEEKFPSERMGKTNLRDGENHIEPLYLPGGAKDNVRDKKKRRNPS